MHTPVQNALKQLQYGDAQVFLNLTIIPLLNEQDAGPHYLTLGEASAAGLIEIGEISESGSVPQIKALNKADQPILLIDGEELIGAKQNRVVNTTILLKEKSETRLPVSCTEQGRWHSVSPDFQDAGNVMARKVRQGKHRSVSQSLKRGGAHCSDQGEVWREIHGLAREARVDSPTGAMQDIYKSRKAGLAECLAATPFQERQIGLIAAIDGRVVGMDCVSRASAYRHLHEKILKSYALDVLLRRRDDTAGKPLDPGPDAGPDAVAGQARTFVQQVVEQCQERSFPSVGHGEDFRYEGALACGSALVYQETTIHSAFFAEEPQTRQDREGGSGPMSYGPMGHGPTSDRMDRFETRRHRLRRKDEE